MQSSEAWIAPGYKEKSKSLAFYLADQGFDVWYFPTLPLILTLTRCGNSRGNKYSYKHVKLSPNTTKFFNFSLDDLAMEVRNFHEIPHSQRTYPQPLTMC